MGIGRLGWEGLRIWKGREERGEGVGEGSWGEGFGDFEMGVEREWEALTLNLDLLEEIRVGGGGGGGIGSLGGVAEM